MIINEKTWRFIRAHADDDVQKLALKGSKDADINQALALQQIAGRQTARRKLPSWAQVEGIVYPPHLNMEQCSSEQTARYKAAIINRLLTEGHLSDNTFVDLTGGFGIDFFWMSQNFQKRYYVEQNEQLCAISSENFKLLEHDCSVSCCDAATYLAEMSHTSVAYLDPARRDGPRRYRVARRGAPAPPQRRARNTYLRHRGLHAQCAGSVASADGEVRQRDSQTLTYARLAQGR